VRYPPCQFARLECTAGLFITVVSIAIIVPLTLRAEEWFAPPVITESEHAFNYCASADLNRDGLDDLVAHDGTWFMVYLSDSIGHMTAVDSIHACTFGDGPFVLIDENHDGWIDIVGDRPYVGRIGLWHNDGRAHFTEASKSFDDQVPIVKGDVDSDGFEDVLTHSGEWMLIYYGGASGLASEPQLLRFGPADHSYYLEILGIAVADLGGDGNQDLVVAGYTYDDHAQLGATIRWRHGQGNRQFGEFREFTMGSTEGEFSNPATTDLEGDGDTDLAVLLYDLQDFGVRLLYYDPASDQFSPSGTLYPSGRPYFGLIDDDALPDLFVDQVYVAPYRSKTLVYRGSLENGFDVVQELLGARGATLGHVLTAGRPDMLAVGQDADQNPQITVWRNIAYSLASSGGSGESAERSSLQVWPTVATRGVAIRVATPGTLRGLTVHSVVGRPVRRLSVGPEGQWDLCDDNGRPAPSGVYFLQLEGHRSHSQPARVVVIR